MPGVTFYKQVREDGGVRTGVESTGATLLECFRAGNEDWDPALKWYIDLRFEVEEAPQDAEEARRWLSERGDAIRTGLRDAADKLAAGFDADLLPLQLPLGQTEKGEQIKVVASATRRVAALDIAKEFRRLADGWDDELAQLDLPATV